MRMRALGSFLAILVCSKQVYSRFKAFSKPHDLLYLSELGSDLEELLPPLLVPRVSGTAGNKIVQAFLIKTLEDLDYHITQDKFNAKTPVGMTQFNNIIATKNPSAKNKLILAAHYDSKLFQGNDVFIGATDSSAPCAIILDVAMALNNLFEKREDALNDETTLQLIFFDGEEAFVSWTETDSLYGSRHLASSWNAQIIIDGARSRNLLSFIDALVVLDLLGSKDVQGIINTNEVTSWFWERIVSSGLFIIHHDLEQRLYERNLLSRHRASFGLATYFKSGWSYLSEHSTIDDDHRPFKVLGVPCVHIIPQPFPNVWHTLADDASAIDIQVVRDYALIFRVVIAEYFGLLRTDD